MSKKPTTKVPKCPKDIVDRILHYGNFKHTLDYLVSILESKTSTSIIISGSVGIGKTSLVHEAIKGRNIIGIWLRPYHFTDDFAALRYIATELKLSPKISLNEVVEDLEERCLATDKKIVIVLPNFEDFCRKRQSLLYCLTHLTQHGDNISLIGLTYSFDCTEHLEKRVRSRINASFHELKPPYDNYEEYLQFASLLLGGHKIGDDLKERLLGMYTNGQRSIRPLKRLLVLLASWKGGKLTLDKCPQEDDQDYMYLLEKRVAWLTRPQLEMLMMVLYYCHTHHRNHLTLQELEEFARNHNHNQFDSISHLAIRNAAFLVKNSFLKHSKIHKMIDRHSELSVNMLPIHFKAVMIKHPELHIFKTDNLWKKFT